ncbi:MAG: dihydroorotase, partial [Chloroflexia bacterium]|nr:dihydroorotase [Chloroflexia bacterium]
MRLLIKDGCIVDPSQSFAQVADVLIVDGRIVEIAGGLTSTAIDPQIPGTHVIDASGCILAPGFVDLHCHLREPGYEDKETIATGTEAAARGGFTTVCAMPNTQPPPDTAGSVRHLLELVEREARVRVLPVGAITKNRAGQEITEMGDLQKAGVVAFSDDGSPVRDGRIMRNAMLYSTMLGLPILAHCEDANLSEGGDMHEGPLSTLLGLQGYPAAAEISNVAREIALAELTGAHLHVCHVSTAGAVELVRQAKARGVRVTAEVTPHHLLLSEAWVSGSMFQSLSLGGSEPMLPIPP